MRRPTSRVGRWSRAFTLAEILVAASVGLILIVITTQMLTSVAKWYASSQAKVDYATQIKLIDQRIRPDCSGVGYFEVFDDYPSASGAGGAKVHKDRERGGNLIIFVVVDPSDPLTTTPAITRVYGYYADVTASDISSKLLPEQPTVRLRRFDSANSAANSDAVRAWRARFPVTLNYAEANSSIASLLPPAAAKSLWPEIAKLDYGAIRLSQQVRAAYALNYAGASDSNTGLIAQLFYGRPGAVMMNLPIRYGTARDSYLVPLTLSFATHQ